VETKLLEHPQHAAEIARAIDNLRDTPFSEDYFALISPCLEHAGSLSEGVKKLSGMGMLTPKLKASLVKHAKSAVWLADELSKLEYYKEEIKINKDLINLIVKHQPYSVTEILKTLIFAKCPLSDIYQSLIDFDSKLLPVLESALAVLFHKIDYISVWGIEESIRALYSANTLCKPKNILALMEALPQIDQPAPEAVKKPKPTYGQEDKIAIIGEPANLFSHLEKKGVLSRAKRQSQEVFDKLMKMPKAIPELSQEISSLSALSYSSFINRMDSKRKLQQVETLMQGYQKGLADSSLRFLGNPEVEAKTQSVELARKVSLNAC
jgi:hypothetical protein